MRNTSANSLPTDQAFWDRLTYSLRKLLLKTNSQGSRLLILQALDAVAEHVWIAMCQGKDNESLEIWIRHRTEWLEEIRGLEAALSDAEREWVAKIKEKLSLI